MNRSVSVFWGGLAILAVASLAVFFTAPLQGAFLWSESPRNALDGAFVLDLVREHPLHDPMGWASAYYLRYPALTVLFYPPLLHVALAVFYAVFGVSHIAAMGCILCFMFALACATARLARPVDSPKLASGPAAIAGALLLLAAPEVLLWGQQVMLEIPMMALAAWGAVFARRYAATDRARDLALATAFLLAAVYTKQTAAFVAAGVALGLLVATGPRLLARAHLWVIVACSLVALIPLAWMQLRFGAFNITSVVARTDVDVPQRFSVAGVSWYLLRLPHMAGWPMLALAALFGVGCILRPAWRPARADAAVLIGWLLVFYVAISLIDLKETRHGLPLLVPLAVFAAAALDRVVAALRVPSATAAALPALAAMLLALSIWQHPTEAATGYAEAAALIARTAPPDGRVLFVGNHDGAFIFDVRARTERRDISVVRADKLFLGIAIIPELGLHARDLDAAQVAEILRRDGISEVVAVPHSWTEAPVMAALEAVLSAPPFTEIARIPVTGAVGERELVVYRYTGVLPEHPERIAADLPAVGLRLAAPAAGSD